MSLSSLCRSGLTAMLHLCAPGSRGDSNPPVDVLCVGSVFSVRRSPSTLPAASLRGWNSSSECRSSAASLFRSFSWILQRTGEGAWRPLPDVKVSFATSSRSAASPSNRKCVVVNKVLHPVVLVPRRVQPSKYKKKKKPMSPELLLLHFSEQEINKFIVGSREPDR